MSTSKKPISKSAHTDPMVMDLGETKFRNLILQAPLLINTNIGPTFIVDTINRTALEIWGKSYEQVINRPLFDSSPLKVLYLLDQ